MARPFLRRNRRYGVRRTSRNPAVGSKSFRRAAASRKARAARFAKNRVLTVAARPTAIRSVPRSLNPFPSVKWAVHRYADRVSFAQPVGIGSGTGYQFRANSLYDPDLTGGGHQPMFRDECAAQYAAYTVLSSQIKITIPNLPGFNVPAWFSLVTDDSSTAETNRTQIWETRKGWTVTTPSLRNNNLVLRAFFDAAKILGTTRKAVLSDDAFKTGAGNNPNRNWYFNFWMQPLSAIDQLPAMDVVIEMSFVTVWRDKAQPTVS